jgi:2-succinyl-6-hydroxy-2,4-cyclohexadiene-1-carboxylate synthase
MIRRITVPGGVVEVAEHGPHHAGRRPVILLHGFTGDHTALGGLASALATDRCVLVPSLPGHGRTALREVSFGATASALGSMLRALGIGSIDVVGYSMGGRFALFWALEHPEIARALVLESASAGAPTEVERRTRRVHDEELARRLEAEPLAAFVAWWEAQPLFASQTTLPVAVRASERARRLRATPAGLAQSLRGMGTGVQPWLGARLGALDVPALVVAGALDAKFSAIAHELAVAIPGAALRIVPGAGHAVHLEQPAAFAALVRDFLDGIGGTSWRSTG